LEDGKSILFLSRKAILEFALQKPEKIILFSMPPMDALENLSAPYCADITRVVLASIVSLACASEAPGVSSKRGGLPGRLCL
jgi:hypothetical protein